MGDRRAAARENAAGAAATDGAIHVSCLVTPAARAAPVLELVPPRRAVRCVAKAARHRSAADAAADGAEWLFHAVFRPPPACPSPPPSPSSSTSALAAELWREVTLPALLCACRGVNTNLMAWGVHPTQKFRLLFGRSTGGLPRGGAARRDDALELHGQLGALLHALFAREDAAEWRLGLSSWLVVDNRVVDLLAPAAPTAAATTATATVNFTTLEASDLTAACRILQTAKTNRVVAKQHAERAHLFVRLALFRGGQLSALHLADLADLRDLDAAPDDARELLELLTALRQPPSPRASASASASVSALASSSALLSFVRPLLTANAQTFLLANVIDSRANLRESVALLSAVANLRGFSCPCRRLSGVSLAQLGFQPPPVTAEKDKDACNGVDGDQPAPASPASPPPASAPPSEAMQWLETFQQRKREILGAPSHGRESEGGSGNRSEQAALSASAVDVYEQLQRFMLAAERPSSSCSPRSSVSNDSPPRVSTEEDREWDRAVAPSPSPSPSPSPPPKQSTSMPPPTLSAPPTRQQPPDDFEAQCARVGVPSTSSAAPDVTGLDAETAGRVRAADASLLRRNYDALLAVVREQQQLREAAEARAREAELDREELRAALELQVESLKLDNVALRSKARLLEKRSGAADALELYDRDVQALQRQVQRLQERNVSLELRLASPDGSFSSSSGGGDLKKKYQQVVDEKLQLEQELAAMRKRERQMMVCSRLVGASTRKADQLARDLSEKEQALTATRLGQLRMNAERNQAAERAELLHKENARLLVDKAAATEELVATKMYLASLEAEHKKAEILDRFVQKHGYHMRELRQEPSSGQYARAGVGAGRQRPQPWHRDREAKESEERLLAAVKRALPQAVPLVLQLLRRLETQELSLRELSAREADLIHMLVELASDQPTTSLKRMIEDEMHKLTLC